MLRSKCHSNLPAELLLRESAVTVYVWVKSILPLLLVAVVVSEPERVGALVGASTESEPVVATVTPLNTVELLNVRVSGVTMAEMVVLLASDAFAPVTVIV
jgi:hypothetical protein